MIVGLACASIPEKLHENKDMIDDADDLKQIQPYCMLTYNICREENTKSNLLRCTSVFVSSIIN